MTTRRSSERALGLFVVFMALRICSKCNATQTLEKLHELLYYDCFVCAVHAWLARVECTMHTNRQTTQLRA